MNNKNIFKKIILSLFAVFAFSFAILIPIQSSKLAFADNVQIGFKGSQVPILSKFYENGSLVVGFSRHNKTFNFNIVDNKIQISCFGHYTQQLLYNETSQTFTQHTDYGNFGFANVSQVSSQPHDNVLVSGTYKWLDSLDFNVSSSITQNLSFTCPNSDIVYSSLDFNKAPPYFSYFTGPRDETLVYSEDGWMNINYQTIILNSDQQVNSIFFDWAITQGNLVYQGGSSSTEVTNVKTVSISYGVNQTNELQTYFYLAGSDNPDSPDSNKKYYVPVTITTDNLKNLDFVGVKFDNDNVYEDINEPLSKVTYYNSVTYFTADNGFLKISYLSSLDNQSTSIYNREHIYYFTATSGDNYNLGYQDGYNAGNIDGKQLGYNQGFDNGRNDGYNNGYNSGYSAGVESAHNYTFLSLISAVVTVPFTAFKSIFNFDLLGVNIFTLVGSLFTIAVILTIIKKVI